MVGFARLDKTEDLFPFFLLLYPVRWKMFFLASLS